MERNKQQMEISTLVAAIMEELESKSYSLRYINDIRRVYRNFSEYCEANEQLYYNALLGQQFLQDHYGIVFGVKEVMRSEVRRAINMLSDYQNFGAVLRRTSAKLEFPEGFDEQAQAFIESSRKRGLTDGTVRSIQVILRRLTHYLVSHGVLVPADITIVHLNGYIKATLCNFSNKHVAHDLRIMRRFLKYLHENGAILEDLSDSVVKVRSTSQPAHLPSAFKSDEVKRMLGAVDRNSPVGKRDYAILLIAAKLGLRSGDIKSLKFENLDWENNAIRLSQGKTGEPLSLYLLPDVGWAIIDYIKHGRPVSDAPEVFVRQVAPHIQIKELNNVLQKYLRLAKVPVECVRHHGMHTLRHSLATTLLEQGRSIYDIQAVLGHLDPNTTKRYISMDIKQLMACALEVPYDTEG